MSKKAIKYDRHARRRMKWRLISEVEVEQVLANPDETEMTQHGRESAFKAIGDRYIKVTYKKQDGEILVISAVDKRD